MLDKIPDYIAAVAALGTSAAALVDAGKAFDGGVSNCGFHRIRAVITRLFPDTATPDDRNNPLDLGAVIDTLRANWLNGTALADQKAIAKSLIKLRLDVENAAHLAKATGVDAAALTKIAGKIQAGTALGPEDTNVFGRFDLILTALLDEGYQRADQIYRNSARAWAVAVSVILAVFGGAAIWVPQQGQSYFTSADLVVAVLVGLIATPLAPVSKDLISALSAAVKTMQALRK